jgi:hypothetical protein
VTTPGPRFVDSPAAQPGDGPAPAPRPSSLRIWLLAARPATLPAALSGVVVGIGAALGVGGSFRVDTALGCMAVALLLQVVANFANDLSDFRRGADTPDRSGPTRVAAAGLVTERQLELAIALTIGIAGIIGLWLAYVGGPVLLLLGVLAVVAALAYTGGPWPYGYRALGEVFVFIFFGLVAVIGTAYLQVLRMEPLFVAAAIPPGALITAILVVNNLREGRVRTAACGLVRGADRSGGCGSPALGSHAPHLPADGDHVAGRGTRLHRTGPAQPGAQGHGPPVADLRSAVRGGPGAQRALLMVTGSTGLACSAPSVPCSRGPV